MSAENSGPALTGGFRKLRETVTVPILGDIRKLNRSTRSDRFVFRVKVSLRQAKAFRTQVDYLM